MGVPKKKKKHTHIFEKLNGTHILELSEWNKLDNISHGSLACSRAQKSIISIQELHGAEVGPAHSHDNNRHGQTRGFDDGVASLIHVRDHAIGDDEQYQVLL